jgi:hypothetical protein
MAKKVTDMKKNGSRPAPGDDESAAVGQKPPSIAPKQTRSTKRRGLVRYEHAEPRPTTPAEFVEETNRSLDPNPWLEQCEAKARKVLQNLGYPAEHGLWHKTADDKWRKPLFGEDFAVLAKYFQLGSVPWLAAQILCEARMAREAIASNDSINAFFAGVRLEEYRSDLELELKGHRKAAEIGDAVAASGRQSNLDRQQLHERWLARDQELKQQQPSMRARARARQIADEEREKESTVWSALWRKQKKRVVRCG